MLVLEKMKKSGSEKKRQNWKQGTKRATQTKTNVVTGNNITFLLYLLSLNLTKCEKANFPLEAKWWQY